MESQRFPLARSPLALVVTVVLGALAPTLWLIKATDASMTAAATTQGQWSTASVVLTDDDTGQALFSVAGMIPGQSRSRCLTVTYTGTAPAQVRVYGSVGGSGLADHLDLRITRGSIPGGGAEDCTGFTPDGAAHLGQGHDPGVVYDSTLSAFPTAPGRTPTARTPATGSPETPTPTASRSRCGARTPAPGFTAAPTFVVAARNDSQPELSSGRPCTTA